MADSAILGEQGTSSASTQQKKSEAPPFFVSPSGTESINTDEGPPITAGEDFDKAPTGSEESPATKPKAKPKGDGEFDKARQQYDQEAANMRRQNQELTARVEDQGKQLAEALEQIKSPTKAEPEQKPFEPLTADSDVEELVEALNRLGQGNGTGLAQQVSKLQKQFEQDRSDRAKTAEEAERQSYLADMGTILDAGEKDFGKKARQQVEEQVGAEMTRRGFGVDKLPDLYTLELAIEKSFLEVSGGRKKRAQKPPSNTVILDTGTGGSPDAGTNSFEPKTLNDWTADAKRRAAAGNL
jgi:hypothetical protein